MNQFLRFDISDFFNEVQAPMFIIDAEEIIFFNTYFKENFLLPQDDWKILFSSEDHLSVLSQFFEKGEPLKEKLLKAIENYDGVNVPHLWEFTNLPSSYQNGFLVAKGYIKKEIKKTARFIPELNSEKPIKDEIQYLRTILHNSHDLISILDEKGTYKYISPSVREKLGFSADEIIGRNYREFLNLGVLDLIKGDFSEVFKTDKEVNIDFLIKRKDGENIYIESFAKNLLDNPYVNGILFSARDITEFTNIKEDLRRSEEKYRSLVEESTEIIFSLSDTFNLLYVSPNIRQFLGYESEDVVGRSIFDYLDLEDSRVFKEILLEERDFLAQNQFLEFKLRHKDGAFRVFKSNGKMIQNKEGGFPYYTGIARDISSLKEAQRELLVAKEKAEQASLVKSQFLSVMSHEIRTPMNALIGVTHFLMEENPRPDQLENLRTLLFSAENLMALINDILDYNKIDSQNIELENVSFDLRNMTRRLVHSHIFQAREKGLELTCLIDSSIPEFLLGDPVRLSQIINNLVSNSIKFTETGYVSIELKQVLGKGDINRIRFIFSDSGIGVPKEKLSHIFEAFTQASSDTTRKFGGTGLGLAIVKRLVELHESEIHLKSEEGKGTSFDFEIDFKIPEISNKEMIEGYKNKIKSLQDTSILVAEDNLVNQILIKKFLNKWEVGNLVFSSDGQEAIDKFQEADFDLILLDLQMPILDGFSVARFIREHPDQKKQETPILVLTASSIHEIKDQIEEVGVNGFVPKPFTPEVLYDKIVSHLNPKNS